MASKNKIYIISGIFAVLPLFLIACCIFLFNGIVKKSKELLAGEEKVVVLQKEFDDIEAFKKQYNSYEPNLEKIDQLFIDSHNPVDFIEFLEKTTSDYGIELNMSVPSFSTGLPIAGDFNVSLSGSFSKIFWFIKEIENGPYLIQIKNLDISKDKANLSMRVLAK